MGSKNGIAKFIYKNLPSGNRLVDLFGGGGAVIHFAIEMNQDLIKKYNSFYYNDYDPMVVKYFKMAIEGNYDITKWISREDFFRLKDTDPVVKYCWSFGNNGRAYLYGKNIEEYKKALWYKKVYNDNSLYCNFRKEKKENQLRRLQSLQKLQSLQSLERLQSLKRLERLERLVIDNISYLDYVYKDGDVVYCDPPYENTEGYDNKVIETITFYSELAKRKYTKNIKRGFDSQQFYNWVATRPYQVFFSSYEISDDRFKIVDKIEKMSLLKAGGCNKKITEYIYTNSS